MNNSGIPNFKGKSATGWLIAIYFFAILGGILGFGLDSYVGVVICHLLAMCLGFYVFIVTEVKFDPMTRRTYKLKKYKSSHCLLAQLGVILTVIIYGCWKLYIKL